MASLYSDYQKQAVSAVEFVASYILAVQFVTLKNRALGPRLQHPLTLNREGDTIEARKPRTLVDRPHHTIAQLQTRLHDLTAVNVFQYFSLTSVPLSVNRAIVGWHNQTHNLKLLFQAPSADEIMCMQSRGERVVTVFASDQGAENHFQNERDPFSFTLHDLIHADLFFGDLDQHRKQVEFFHALKEKIYSDKAIQTLRAQNRTFSERLNYLASDMNSNDAHLASYFHHLLQEFNLT